MTGIVIRDRQTTDLDACVQGLRAVHAADAYPLNWPRDPAAWLTPPGTLAAWVAESPDGTIAGHAAIHRAGAHAELSRLFVVPSARRGSVATALLSQARSWAATHRWQLTLSVTDEHRSAAVAFYEASGWHHTHTTDADWTTPSGDPVRLRHYKQPTQPN